MFCSPNTTGGFSICNVADIGFSCHLKGWSCKEAKLVSITQPAKDEIVAESFIEAISSRINLCTRLKFSISPTDGFFELWLSACPDQDEQGFCSGRLNLLLPVSFWADGSVKFAASTKLPNAKDAIAKDASLFEGRKVNMTQMLQNFSITSADSALTLTLSAPADRKSSFYDLRQWCPYFEVRMEDFGGGGSTWAKGDKKEWYCKVAVKGNGPLSLKNIYSTTLTKEEKTFLKENGFIQLSGLLPKENVQNALRILNLALRNEGAKAEYSSKYTAAPELTTLVNSSQLTGVLADLFGIDKMPKAWSAQIAMVFPKEGVISPIEHMGYHIDGEPNYMNKADFHMDVPKLNDFNALVGIYLKDIVAENHGNFSVFPGSHYKHAKYFAEHGPDSIVNNHGKMALPKLDLGKARQLTCKAGDVVIANYSLAHTVACHGGPDIRYAIYFRLTVRGHETQRVESLKQPWLEWPGLA